MGLGEVYLPLAALDVLEPDLVPQVDAAYGRRGDHGLAEASVEQLRLSARDRFADSCSSMGRPSTQPAAG